MCFGVLMNLFAAIVITQVSFEYEDSMGLEMWAPIAPPVHELSWPVHIPCNFLLGTPHSNIGVHSALVQG